MIWAKSCPETPTAGRRASRPLRHRLAARRCHGAIRPARLSRRYNNSVAPLSSDGDTAGRETYWSIEPDVIGISMASSNSGEVDAISMRASGAPMSYIAEAPNNHDAPAVLGADSDSRLKYDKGRRLPSCARQCASYAATREPPASARIRASMRHRCASRSRIRKYCRGNYLASASSDRRCRTDRLSEAS